MAELSRLQSPAAVQRALDEFSRRGRTDFLRHYGFGKSRDYLVRNPATGELCDSKAIAGAAYGYQDLTKEHSGQRIFQVARHGCPEASEPRVRIVTVGEDWNADEVDNTVAAYFDMLLLEARQQPYTKRERNLALRQSLRGRSKSSVEWKHQNVSAVLDSLGLPFIPGYKPRPNAQLLLRKSVHQYVLDHPDLVAQVVDAFEEVKAPSEKEFRAVLVDPPAVEMVLKASRERARLPRKVDFGLCDQANRKLGRAGEQWVIDFEHRRLVEAGLAELFQNVDWISDRLGDGTGYDILSFESPTLHRYIEVKTTNG